MSRRDRRKQKKKNNSSQNSRKIPAINQSFLWVAIFFTIVASIAVAYK
jgi:hypothetical protein